VHPLDDAQRGLDATLSWPAAVVAATAVASVGLILTVGTWQIFRTGQTAIKSERGRPEA
jgi:hypothetical protein